MIHISHEECVNNSGDPVTKKTKESTEEEEEAHSKERMKTKENGEIHSTSGNAMDKLGKRTSSTESMTRFSQLNSTPEKAFKN